MAENVPQVADKIDSSSNEAANALLSRLSQILWAELDSVPEFYDAKPLLAHYTSIQTLESIFKNRQLWFSNPLYMNDLEEVRFGILEGLSAFMASQSLELACGTPQRAALLRQNFKFLFDSFEREHALDTYVFCLSEHVPGNDDGLLSMWRGYAANGSGAAIVFDTGRLIHNENTPLTLARVIYASVEKRRKWIIDKIEILASFIRDVPHSDEQLFFPAFAFFERLKLFALFTKHPGFEEEREWRAVYRPERDLNKSFSDMIEYTIGPRGIENKLKLRLEPIHGLIEDDFTLDKLIHRIILGPTLSSPLTRAAVIRMLNRYAPTLVERLATSSIPFRSV